MNSELPRPTPPELPVAGEARLQTVDERPVLGLAESAETMLRRPLRIIHHLRTHGPLGLIRLLTMLAMLAIVAYGLVVGSFSGGSQWWAAPVKIAAGLVLSVLICLPSLYIFACLSGSNARFGEILGLVCGVGALMAILLVGFAPVAWVFSQSTESVVAMGVLHLVFWTVALVFAFGFLRKGFEGQVSRSAGITVWMVIFVLVMVQMTTALRPLVGTADTFLPTQKRLFLAHWVDCLRTEAEAPARP